MSGVTWQWVGVLVIEITAIAFLLRRIFGPIRAPVRRKPDVPVSSLVRKKR